VNETTMITASGPSSTHRLDGRARPASKALNGVRLQEKHNRSPHRDQGAAGRPAEVLYATVARSAKVALAAGPRSSDLTSHSWVHGPDPGGAHQSSAFDWVSRKLVMFNLCK